MIWRDLFLKERVCLHSHEVLDVVKHDLDKGIVVGNVCELRVKQPAHLAARG